MTPRVRRTLTVLAVVVAFGAVGLAVAVVVRSDDGAVAVAPADAQPARHTGPQGRVGQFVVTCTYSHSAPDDPIVHPDRPGESHRHDFYGATGTKASSTIEGLQAGDTTCNKKVDTAAYWQPTLYDYTDAVVPVEANVYYRAAPGVEPTDVVTVPEGMALIAGDFTATTPQAGEATGWTCGSATTLSDDPPDCAKTAPLHLVLTFQDCWNGTDIDSLDHQSHVTYSTDGECPEGFGTHIPQVTMSIKYPIWGPGHQLSLASGNIYSAHGDFWNAWDPAGLEREITSCIHRDVVCDLASNREEEALFSGP